MRHLIFLLECRLLFYSWHVLHGQALPGSMSGSLKTILRGSTSRVNLPNAQSNDCGRSPTNDGNGNATGPRPGCGITERPSPTLVVAVYEIIPSISFASPTAVRNINWNIMFQLIFPVVGSFFSLFLRSPMVMIRSPGVVLLLGFF